MHSSLDALYNNPDQSGKVSAGELTIFSTSKYYFPDETRRLLPRDMGRFLTKGFPHYVKDAAKPNKGMCTHALQTCVVHGQPVSHGAPPSAFLRVNVAHLDHERPIYMYRSFVLRLHPMQLNYCCPAGVCVTTPRIAATVTPYRQILRVLESI